MNLNSNTSNDQKFLIQLPSFFEDYIEEYSMKKWEEEVKLVKSSGFECIENASDEQLRRLGAILDRFSEKSCIPIEPFDLFLTKTISRIQSYPLSCKTIKKLKDSTLLDQMKQLIETMKKVTQFFLDWQLSLDEDINLYKTFIPSPEESLKKTTKLKENYETMKLSLEKILKVKKVLLKEVEIRIIEDIKHKSSTESLELISSSHHTTLDKQTGDSDNYHSFTDFLNETSKKDIKSEQKKLDDGKTSFENSFNLLSYLVNHNLLCTKENEKYFKRWNKIGWYNYLDAKVIEALQEPNFDEWRVTVDFEQSDIYNCDTEDTEYLSEPTSPINIAYQRKIFDENIDENDDVSSFIVEYSREFSIYESASQTNSTKSNQK